MVDLRSSANFSLHSYQSTGRNNNHLTESLKQSIRAVKMYGYTPEHKDTWEPCKGTELITFTFDFVVSILSEEMFY